MSGQYRQEGDDQPHRRVDIEGMQCAVPSARGGTDSQMKNDGGNFHALHGNLFKLWGAIDACFAPSMNGAPLVK